MASHLSLAEHRAQRDKIVKGLLSQVNALTKSLHHLADPDRERIVALIAAAQMLTVYERSENRPDTKLARQFEGAVTALSPNIAERLGVGLFSRACLGESVGYATAMARCLSDSRKNQEQCERESAPQAGAEIACVMKALDGLIKSIRPIIPGPIPGPQPKPFGVP